MAANKKAKMILDKDFKIRSIDEAHLRLIHRTPGARCVRRDI